MSSSMPLFDGFQWDRQFVASTGGFAISLARRPLTGMEVVDPASTSMPNLAITQQASIQRRVRKLCNG